MNSCVLPQPNTAVKSCSHVDAGVKITCHKKCCFEYLHTLGTFCSLYILTYIFQIPCKGSVYVVQVFPGLLEDDLRVWLCDNCWQLKNPLMTWLCVCYRVGCWRESLSLVCRLWVCSRPESSPNMLVRKKRYHQLTGPVHIQFTAYSVCVLSCCVCVVSDVGVSWWCVVGEEPGETGRPTDWRWV